MMTRSSMFFQSPSSNLMEVIILLHDYVSLLLLTILILIFMEMLLMLNVNMFKMDFYKQDNLENIWTIIPFMIFISISIPSLNSLYFLDSCLFCGLNLNVVGHQWYWVYMIKNKNITKVESYMESKNVNLLRLLDVDNRAILPTLTPIRCTTTSSDVIHSWSIPSMGLKMDAVPGRMNQLCLISKKSGIYFGQCSEICGINHSFMPIVVEFVPLKNFLKLM